MSARAVLSFDEAEATVAEALETARIVAVDGAPVAGKSTLAKRLKAKFGLHVLGLDEFFSGPAAPSWPFRYYRYDAFIQALDDWRQRGRFRYQPFDWLKMRVSESVREVATDGPLLVEGCSLLQPDLADRYDVAFFVESDLASRQAAQRERDGAFMADTWRDAIWPSVELYLATQPARLADHLVAGRGCTPRGPRS